jgi:predicted CXXCH cytochrome family protein
VPQHSSRLQPLNINKVFNSLPKLRVSGWSQTEYPKLCKANDVKMLNAFQIFKGKKHMLLFALFFPFCLLIASPSVYSLDSGMYSHLDKSNLPKGCGSCHRGHGVLNTPMLPESEEVFCYRCHGNSSNMESRKHAGDLSMHIYTTDLPDIEKEFDKPYRHPADKIVTRRYSRALQRTDRMDRTAERHAECTDCHNPHFTSKQDPMAGIQGVNSQGLDVGKIEFEYQLCFKCHANSANLPPDEKNKADQFKASNPSYHPVVAQGKNRDVPSLIFPLNSSSIIKCTDCHNNDDLLGPKGPHGSSYRYILKKNYTETDGTEGSFQYELCYSCHRRESILGNESFLYHDLHISVVGASCRTCHNPHGSTQYEHLIDFDNLSVSPSSKGFVEYRSLGKKAGECFLTCHGKDHSPLSYPVSDAGGSS